MEMMLWLAMGMQTAASAVRLPEPEVHSTWSASEDWEVSEVSQGDARSCVATSKPIRVGGRDYRVSLSFGDRNEVMLRSSSPLAATTQAALETDNGGGLDMGDIGIRRQEGEYLAFNEVSRPMFRRVIEDLAGSTGALFRLGAAAVPLPMGDFAAAYGDMKACQRSLIGLVIDIN